MPTSYFDQFFILDPAAPPAPGTVLNKSFFEIIDQNNNGLIQRNGADSVNGFDITRVWPGDTITVTMNGVTTTITGTTFYLNGHPPVFTPTDGTLHRIQQPSRFRPLALWRLGGRVKWQ